ncbi:hypothetical protein HK100_007083 [Physocladia obscura]|uniref:Zn(2)-C6 fungal-type domain-containing protein n=1 Tax=Physocladia obscura TaxID=109957 RepID=A0AAD5T534_9FUNG|nr:hypothetical protein HK100_007083 [Physocladia obscura]
MKLAGTGSEQRQRKVSSSGTGSGGRRGGAGRISARTRSNSARKTPCQNCRLRRRACDLNRPACGRCVTHHLECEWPGEDDDDSNDDNADEGIRGSGSSGLEKHLKSTGRMHNKQNTFPAATAVASTAIVESSTATSSRIAIANLINSSSGDYHTTHSKNCFWGSEEPVQPTANQLPPTIQEIEPHDSTNSLVFNELIAESILEHVPTSAEAAQHRPAVESGNDSMDENNNLPARKDEHQKYH